MSESHYWPTEPGKYQIEADAGYTDEWTLGSDGMWTCDEVHSLSFWTREMAADGYLGVRREQASVDDTSDKYAEAELYAEVFAWRHAKEHGIEIMDDVDGEVIGRATYWEDSGDSSVGIPATGGWELAGSNIRDLAKRANDGDDLAALVREAIAEFRQDVKQPTKAADWAFKWVNRFIEAVES